MVISYWESPHLAESQVRMIVVEYILGSQPVWEMINGNEVGENVHLSYQKQPLLIDDIKGLPSYDVWAFLNTPAGLATLYKMKQTHYNHLITQQCIQKETVNQGLKYQWLKPSGYCWISIWIRNQLSTWPGWWQHLQRPVFRDTEYAGTKLETRK